MEIKVSHAQGTYSVVSATFAQVCERLQTVDALIVDANVARLWPMLAEAQRPLYGVPSGETSKSLHEFGAVVEWLAQSRLTRNSAIGAIGGGVVGDLAGYAAASYMRGISFIQVPTTLLAMVDSCVGGKVGIDLDAGKNLIGAFHAPQEVLICKEFLQTLPERQFVNGLAEVIKYALIMDNSFLDQSVSLERESKDLESTIFHCVELKRQVVEGDEFDRSGQRAILNFGHTVGHALEHATGYGPLLHGEAISIGMVAEARIGEAMGFTEPGTVDVVEGSLATAKLPVAPPEPCEAHVLLKAMKIDKKSGQGKIGMSLLKKAGQCAFVDDVPENLIREVLSK